MEGSKDEAMADTTSTSPPPPIPIGARVELKGLQAKPELNGQTGIVRSFVPSTGRCVVKMDGGAPMKIKPQNLVRITEESLAEVAGMLSLNSSCYDLGFVDVPSRLELDVTGDDDQSMLESLVRIATAKKPAKEDVKYWGGASEPWRNGTDDSAITDPDVIAREEQRKSEAEEEDAVAATGDDVGNHADRLHGFGLQITFLLLLTHELKLWAWKTWEVVQFLVKPATEQHGNRCRFAELPLVERFTGPATVFASHCWGGLWGDLVAAVCAGADKRRVVWIDVFAVRQWPGNGADLDFRGVIARSNATIVAVATVIGKLTEEDDPLRLETSVKSPVGRAAFLASDEYKQASKSLAFCRLWCLVELFATIQAGKGLVFRGACAGKISERRVSLLGTAAAEVAGDDKFKAMLRNAPKVGREGLLSMLAAQNETFVAVARSVWAEEDAKEAAGGDQRGGITVAMIQRMMINCSCIIDVSTASCAVPADRERELAAIELEAEAMGGLEYVNRVVASGVYAGARIANLKTAEGDNFVCGEEEGLRALSPDSLFPALQGAVVADRVGLLEALLEGPLRLQVRSMLCGSTRLNGFLITAAGNDCCAVVERLLREPGVDVNNSDASGRTAVGIACTESHVNVLKQLLDCPRLDPNKKMSFMGKFSESPLQTALKVVKAKQHDERSVAVLRLLIAHPKVDVNAKIDANGLSPLGFAIKLNSLPAVKLLVDHQRVDLNLAMTEYGLTPLHMAGVGNREDIVKLLLEKGADATIQTRLGATALALAQERGHSEIVSILRRVEEEAAMGGLAVGVRVELRGLKAKPELNGHRGVVEKYVASSGRFAVRVDDGLGSFRLKSDNLAIL